MLINFTVKNYMSFKDENTLSMVASKDKTDEEKHVITLHNKERILKNAAIYGANASGKSNLLHAFRFMRYLVINSSKESQSGDEITTKPFMFSTVTENAPSLFEVTFLCDEIIYRYGFEVTRQEVVSEWLFARYSSRESTLFIRDGQQIKVGERFKDGKRFIDAVRDNALFLSVCAQFNGKISSSVISWFRNVYVISSLDSDYVEHSMDIIDNKNNEYDEQKKMMLHLITGIDVGIENIVVEQDTNVSIEKLLDELTLKEAKVLTDKLKKLQEKTQNDIEKKMQIVSNYIASVHKKYNEENQVVLNEICNFNIESQGTQKIFELSGLIIKTIFNGGVLFIDEIQNSLHPNLLIGLISFIINNNRNINSQFIYTTHDVNILAKKLLRRDEYWFVEKSQFGASELSSLYDFDETVRKDASLDKDYLRGRYGAIPYINL